MTDPGVDPTLLRAIAALRTLPDADPTARQRLATALASTPRLRRRGFTLTPTRALLAASVVALVTSIVWLAALSLPTRLEESEGSLGLTPVQFLLAAPEARAVSLVGDFNGWDRSATPLLRGSEGVWSVVVPLGQGSFAYSFIVNGGEWRADPVAPAASDDFGRPSSVLYVAQEPPR